MKILCVDFDGVLHSYTSGWQGAYTVSDPPVDGAMEWLLDCTEHFEVCIYSSRSKGPEGVGAMKNAIKAWLVDSNLRTPAAAQLIVDNVLKFPMHKPAAFLTVDDRCIRFDGVWPSMKMMENFTTWQGR